MQRFWKEGIVPEKGDDTESTDYFPASFQSICNSWNSYDRQLARWKCTSLHYNGFATKNKRGHREMSNVMTEIWCTHPVCCWRVYLLSKINGKERHLSDALWHDIVSGVMFLVCSHWCSLILGCEMLIWRKQTHRHAWAMQNDTDILHSQGATRIMYYILLLCCL